MAIFSVGSINADFFYYVPHLPTPGETLAAHRYMRGLGGKGANQSIAAALAGSETHHVGAVGEDGRWAVDAMRDRGVDVSGVRVSDTATGNAMITVEDQGENSIVLYPGANAALGDPDLQELAKAKPGDLLLLQNEVNLTTEAARTGKANGMRVLYSAAPFDVDAVRDMVPFIDVLLVNAVEHEQLLENLGAVDVPAVLITRGSEGAEFVEGDIRVTVPAVKVDAVDTTGAGDCFAGYFAAGLDQGLTAEAAMKLAAAASALKVTKRGTSDAFPTRPEVDAFSAS